jgi:hypothetical protein
MSILNRALGNAVSTSAKVENACPLPSKALQVSVVTDHCVPIPGSLHVKFEIVGTCTQSVLKGTEGVLGRVDGEAPVGENAGFRRIEERSHCTTVLVDGIGAGVAASRIRGS